MSVIKTKLTTSGNSVAVRLPKELLQMSGIDSKVTLQAKQGKIIISKAPDPKNNWGKQIDKLLQNTNQLAAEFKDMETAANDGLNGLPWDGLSYEEWLKKDGQIS